MSKNLALAKTAGVQLNQWRYGATAPSTALGNIGDFYLNTATGDVHYKSAATTWTLTGNIKGPQGNVGATGATGPAGATGLQGPAGTAGATGPAGAQGIAGTNGINGTNGTAVLNGTTNPTAGIGVNGDFYINTATNTIYGPKANGTWPAGTILGHSSSNGSAFRWFSVLEFNIIP